MFAVGHSSRHWIHTPPYKGCELTADEFKVTVCRYFGAADTLLQPHVGESFRRYGRGQKYWVLDEHGQTLANANVGGDRWRLRHDAVLTAVIAELRAASQEVQDNVCDLFVGKFGERDSESERRAAALLSRGQRRRNQQADGCGGEGDDGRQVQGLVPDLRVQPSSVLGARVVDNDTLFELKQINCVDHYFQKKAATKLRHAVEERAGCVHKDYCRALHEVDRHAGTACDAPLTKGGKCSYTKPWTDDKHSVGGAQRELAEKFGEVQPLVFGHFGELNGRFVELLHRIAESMAFQHHRAHGWKNAKAGICRAKVGVIRRVSMVVLRETARHVVRGLATVGPQSVLANIAARAKTTAAEADLDEFRAGICEDRSFADDFRDAG